MDVVVLPTPRYSVGNQVWVHHGTNAEIFSVTIIERHIHDEWVTKQFIFTGGRRVHMPTNTQQTKMPDTIQWFEWEKFTPTTKYREWFKSCAV
eukprot:8077733-Ditylum_brightwellii.AAC.1